jgi:hypothetical protein
MAIYEGGVWILLGIVVLAVSLGGERVIGIQHNLREMGRKPGPEPVPKDGLKSALYM